MHQHSDGTTCNEGTSSVPEGYTPCCGTFEAHTRACEFDIRYEWWAKDSKWVIAIADTAGGGGIEIGYCPHCGMRLGA